MKSFDHLDANDVQRNLLIQKQIIKDTHPELATDRGVFHDLVLYYSALFATDNQKYVQDAMKALDVERLMQAPDKVSKDVIDRIAGNAFITRKPGKAASGIITCTLDTKVPLVIPYGFSFSVNGFIFKTTRAYTVRTGDGATMLDGDRLLTKSGDQYSFTIPVTAKLVGTAGNIRKGTQLKALGKLSVSLKSITATKNFIGGADEESNVQLLNRTRFGAGTKNWTNRLTAEAVFNQVEGFNDVRLSIIGFGDQEMRRDRHSLWPGSRGGKTDVYIRTAELHTKEVELSGTLVGSGFAEPCWLVDVARDVVPGFYEIKNVRRLDGTACKILSEIRYYDLRDTHVDILEEPEAAYSSFQTATVTVEDDEQGDKFIVEFSYIPGLDKLQKLKDFAVGTDVLIKAPVPCFTTVEVEIEKQLDKIAINVDQLREVIAAEVNSCGLGQKVLTAAGISTCIAKHLNDSRCAVKHINFTGRLRYPNGNVELLIGETGLTVPYLPEQMVTHNTVAFFQDPAAVQITFSTVGN